jgi:hypothetical protein
MSMANEPKKPAPKNPTPPSPQPAKKPMQGPGTMPGANPNPTKKS